MLQLVILCVSWVHFCLSPIYNQQKREGEEKVGPHLHGNWETSALLFCGVPSPQHKLKESRKESLKIFTIISVDVNIKAKCILELLLSSITYLSEDLNYTVYKDVHAELAHCIDVNICNQEAVLLVYVQNASLHSCLCSQKPMQSADWSRAALTMKTVIIHFMPRYQDKISNRYWNDNIPILVTIH